MQMRIKKKASVKGAGGHTHDPPGPVVVLTKKKVVLGSRFQIERWAQSCCTSVGFTGKGCVKHISADWRLCESLAQGGGTQGQRTKKVER